MHSFRNDVQANTRTLPTNWVQTGFSPLWLLLQASLAVAKGFKAFRAKQPGDDRFQTNFHPADFVGSRSGAQK